LPALLAAGLLYAPPAVMAASPASFKDPHGIACPAAPSGWFLPPGDSTPTAGGGRTIIAPGDVVILGEGAQGGNTVNVTCDYFTQAGKHLTVDLLYALPTDPNPINDFYFGCQSGGVKWTNDDRTFRLMSRTQWASVAFFDFLELVPPSDEPQFETVARQLLQNAEGFAHGCDLKVQPTPTISQFQFNFEVSAGKGQGLFYISGLDTSSSLPVVSESVRNMTLNVMSHGTRHPLTIVVTHGVSFVPGRPNRRASVKLAVKVKDSKVPGCRAGSTGTLTVSTGQSVLLKVCSQSFLQGKATVNITSFA
jgi:hypothetical protein